MSLTFLENPNIQYLDWRARKKAKLLMFNSGERAGCVWMVMFQVPLEPASQNFLSFSRICAFALSCQITTLRFVRGNRQQMAGRTFLMRSLRYLFLFKVIGVRILVPAGLLRLVRLAFWTTAIGQIPILPSNVHSLSSLKRGQPTAESIIILVILLLFCVHCFGWSSSNVK